MHKVNGIDIWVIGEPNCKYQIIGYIQQKTVQRSGGLLTSTFNAASNSDLEPAIANEAKKQGGDAIIYISSSSQITGADTAISGNATTYGANTTFEGNARTRITTTGEKQVAVVKYLK